MKRTRRGRIIYPKWCVVGAKVVMLRDVRNKGGDVIKEGEEVTITDVRKGVTICPENPHRSISGVSYDAVRPLEAAK